MACWAKYHGYHCTSPKELLSVTEQTRGGGDILLPNVPLLLSGSPCTGFILPTTRELNLSMPEIGEKERKYLFKKLYGLRVMT